MHVNISVMSRTLKDNAHAKLYYYPHEHLCQLSFPFHVLIQVNESGKFPKPSSSDVPKTSVNIDLKVKNIRARRVVDESLDSFE